MWTTLRLKRAKPRFDAIYAYLCPRCYVVEEAPVNLQCQGCGMAMISVSALYHRELERVRQQLQQAQKKGMPQGAGRTTLEASREDDTEPNIITNLAAFLTEFRTA